MHYASYGTTELRKSEHKLADRREAGVSILGVRHVTLLSRVDFDQTKAWYI
jgi:hypothetical protein